MADHLVQDVPPNSAMCLARRADTGHADNGNVGDVVWVLLFILLGNL